MKYRGLITFNTAAALALIGGCAAQKPQTLASLGEEAVPEPQSVQAPDTITRQEVRTEYEQVLGMVDDERLKEQIERRISEVYMLQGDTESNTVQRPSSYYLEAIKSYREILEKYPNSPGNAEVLYQLAKAYDMEGNQDEALNMLRQLTARYPDYPHVTEAQFRKGDILFNLAAYDEAETAYRAVADRPATRFHLNANYMLGWSRYKQLKYREALQSHVYVLNQVLTPVESLEQLSKPERSLVSDALHSVSLSLDKLGGGAAVETVAALRDQPYVWRIYDNLGHYYLDKELYEASAESYRLFIQHYRDDELTPVFHEKMINTYIEGSFPRKALEEKESYVDAYGLYSTYARSRGGVTPPLKPTLEAYIDELARYYHASGQEVKQQIEDLKENNDRPLAPEKLDEMDTQVVTAMDKAAYFYQQFVDTFPDHEEVDHTIFLRAESLFAGRRYNEAIPGYEYVAYQQQSADEERGANAGYAAIVAYDRHGNRLQGRPAELNDWRTQAVASMLRFTQTYYKDERAPAVLTTATDHILSLGQFERALQIANDLLPKAQDAGREMRKTLHGIMAHSLFKLERFAEARDSYLRQRQLVDRGDDEHRQITEGLATAMYKNSETLLERNDKDAALAELLRLKELAPNSPVRATAQHDAATLLIEQERWAPAIDQLLELREKYADHELAVEYPRKLAIAYEKRGDWARAAREYLLLSESDPDSELRREALYLAVEMFENNDDPTAAVEQLEAYDRRYPQPFDKRMEARYKLVQHYTDFNNTEKRLHWLQALVDGHNQAGEAATERSQWLAAWASSEYGDYYADQFYQQQLSLPLDKSLPGKQAVLEQAVARYQAASDSDLFDFVTMGTYKIGKLYQTFADELRHSPRPNGLGAEEQTLYKEILEEQAQPFDGLAMNVYQSNIDRAWDGEFNHWIEQSFESMRDLNPTRFAKTELIVSYGDEIH